MAHVGDDLQDTMLHQSNLQTEAYVGRALIFRTIPDIHECAQWCSCSLNSQAKHMYSRFRVERKVSVGKSVTCNQSGSVNFNLVSKNRSTDKKLRFDIASSAQTYDVTGAQRTTEPPFRNQYPGVPFLTVW